jgi:hypothetical protein
MVKPKRRMKTTKVTDIDLIDRLDSLSNGVDEIIWCGVNYRRTPPKVSSNTYGAAGPWRKIET